MQMTRDQAEKLARSLPASDRIDAHFIAALASVAGVDATFEGVADWLDAGKRHVLALVGERLVHVVAEDGVSPVATIHRRSDVRRVTAVEVTPPDYFTGYEWWVKRWSVLLTDGTTFAVGVDQMGGRRHDAALELMQKLID